MPWLSLKTPRPCSGRMAERQSHGMHSTSSFRVIQHISPGLCQKETDLGKRSESSAKTRGPELTNQGSRAQLPWSQPDLVLSPRSHRRPMLQASP